MGMTSAEKILARMAGKRRLEAEKSAEQKS
jgi:hypothetical protein